MRFNKDEENLQSLENNPLLLPAQRLLAANIISTLQVDGRTHLDLMMVFFSDEAMLYFLRQARKIEYTLKEVPSFVPERKFPLRVTLPNLTA